MSSQYINDLSSQIRSLGEINFGYPSEIDALTNYDYSKVGYNEDISTPELIEMVYDELGEGFNNYFTSLLKDSLFLSPHAYRMFMSEGIPFRNYYFVLDYLRSLPQLNRIPGIVEFLDDEIRGLKSKLNPFIPSSEEEEDVITIIQEVQITAKSLHMAITMLSGMMRGGILLKKFAGYRFDGLVEIDEQQHRLDQVPYSTRYKVYALLFGGICTKSHSDTFGITFPLSFPDNVDEPTRYIFSTEICAVCHSIYPRAVPDLIEGIPAYYKLRRLIREFELIAEAKITGIEIEGLCVEYLPIELSSITPRQLLGRLLYRINLPDDLQVKINGEYQVNIDEAIPGDVELVEVLEITNHSSVFDNIMKLDRWNTYLSKIENEKLITLLVTGSSDSLAFKSLLTTATPAEQVVAINYGADQDTIKMMLNIEDLASSVYNALILKIHNIAEHYDRIVEFGRRIARNRLSLSIEAIKRIFNHIDDQDIFFEYAKLIPYADADNWFEIGAILDRIKSKERLLELKQYHIDRGNDDDLLVDLINDKIIK